MFWYFEMCFLLKFKSNIKHYKKNLEYKNSTHLYYQDNYFLFPMYLAEYFSNAYILT